MKTLRLAVERMSGPKADGVQRRALNNRIDMCRRRHLQQLHRSEKKAGRGPRRDREDPPEIAAARKLVQDYDDRIEAEWDAVEEAMDKLAAWVAEQVLFTPAQQALQFVKAYESLTDEQAMQAAKSMEDRNDIPLGLPGCTDV